MRNPNTEWYYLNEALDRLNQAIELGKSGDKEEALSTAEHAKAYLEQARDFEEGALPPPTTVWYIASARIQTRHDDSKYVEFDSLKTYPTREAASLALGDMATSSFRSVGAMCDERYNYAWGEADYYGGDPFPAASEKLKKVVGEDTSGKVDEGEDDEDEEY